MKDFRVNCYKLAFVIERYFEFGGLQRDMRRFAVACAKMGHDVTIFTGHWDGPPEPAVKIETANFKSLTNHGTIKKIEEFVETLRQQNTFDCIVGFNRISGLDVYFAGDVCLKAKLQQRQRYWLRFLPRYRTYLKQEEAVFGQASDSELMVISPSEAEKIKAIYKTPPGRIHLLPPGIDRERITADPLSSDRRKQFRKAFGAGDNDLIILTVGSSFHTKGIDRTILAIAALPDELKDRCRYIVAGRGYIKKFQAIANKAGIGERVYFAGGRDDISQFYYSSDILSHPARIENTGTSLLEAMVAGLPVIATENCGYAPYIQKAHAGAVCPEPFVQSRFNQLVEKILADDQKRLEFAANARHYSQTADLYSMFDTGVQVIVNRAGKNRGRP